MIHMVTAIICTTDLMISPFVWFYADLCKNVNKEYVIITKAKTKIEKHGYKIITYVINNNKNKILKFVKWNIWLYKTINKLNIDNIVITPTNTAFSIFPFLIFNSRKYLFDIRDYTKENSFIYKIIEKFIINKAKIVIISSEGFRKWLPLTKTPIYTIHNMPYSTISILNKDFIRPEDKFIVIGYIGYVNYYEENKRLIEKMKNNSKYHLIYSGRISESCPIEKYVRTINTNIVTFTGPYKEEDKSELYKKIDMINAIYGNKSLIVTTALPNKLYDAIIYKKPIIAAKGTFLGELIEKYQIGFTVDIFKDNIIKLLDEFWFNYNRDAFLKNCQEFYKIINDEQKITLAHIVNFLCKK